MMQGNKAMLNEFIWAISTQNSNSKFKAFLNSERLYLSMILDENSCATLKIANESKNGWKVTARKNKYAF